MFSNSYQSGTYIELYNPQNKDLVKIWKFSGKISKEYDSQVKGYINILNAGGVSKMQIPINDKQSLGIVQSYIVFQLFLFSPKSFSIEIAISDTSKTKRRLMFSASSKDIVINPLHCRIPMLNFPIGVWVNFSIDILSFVAECFKSQTFRAVDYIAFTANCKIRRIFSMRNSLVEYNSGDQKGDFQLEYAEILPKNLAFPMNVPHENINSNYDKVKAQIDAEMKTSQSEMSVNTPTATSPYMMKNNVISGENGRREKGVVPNTGSVSNVSPQMKTKQMMMNNIRSKSVNKPVKLQIGGGELENQQEFIDPNEQGFSNSGENNKKKIARSKFDKYDQNGRKIVVQNTAGNNIISNVNLYNNPTVDHYKNKLKKKNFKEGVINEKNLNNFNIMQNLKTDSIPNSEHVCKTTNPTLLNTLNYKNTEKGENNRGEGDSIEEIYDLEEKRTLENERNFEEDYPCMKMQEEPFKKFEEDNEEKYYYDIPIKDCKRKSRDIFNPKSTNLSNKNPIDEEECENKKKIIEEILKDSSNTMAVMEKIRPYTPPFTKLVPMPSVRTIEKGSVIIEKVKEENQKSILKSSIDKSENVIGNVNNNVMSGVNIADSLEFNKSIKPNDSNYLDLIYDQVLGCYYDPKTNIYYELKNK